MPLLSVRVHIELIEGSSRFSRTNYDKDYHSFLRYVLLPLYIRIITRAPIYLVKRFLKRQIYISNRRHKIDALDLELHTIKE